MQPSRVFLPAAAIAAVFAVPFLISKHAAPLGAFYGDWVAAFLGCLLIAVLALWMRRHGDDKQASVLLPWVALAPVLLIATTVAQSGVGMLDITGSRVITQIVLVLGAVLSAVVWQFSQRLTLDERGRILDAIAIALLIAGVLGALTLWVQVFHLEDHLLGLVSHYPTPADRRPWGNLNQANHQATVEGLALAASVWLWSRGKLRLPGWLTAMLLIESGLVLTASRTGLLFVGLSVSYALIVAVLARGKSAAKHRLTQHPRRLAAVAGIMVVSMIVLQFAIRAGNQMFDWNLIDAVSRIGEGDQMASRSPLWSHALAMFRTHAWLGVGYGEYAWNQFEQMGEIGTTAAMSLHAHNAFLDMLAKTGIVGTASVVLVLLAWLWRVVRGRLITANLGDRAQTLVVLTWLAMLGAHALLEYPLHYVYFFVPLCFMLAWLDTAGFGDSQRFPGRTAIVAFLTLAAISLVTLWQDYGRIEARERAHPDRLATMPMPSFWFGTFAQTQLVLGIVITPENAGKLLPFQLEAVHLSPSPWSIRRTAWIFALTGQPDRGRQWLERLQYYYQGDQGGQIAKVQIACNELDPAVRPRDFCAWVQTKSSSIGD